MLFCAGQVGFAAADPGPGGTDRSLEAENADFSIFLEIYAELSGKMYGKVVLNASYYQSSTFRRRLGKK